MSVVVRMDKPENCTCCPMCFTADVQGYHWCAALEQEVEEGLSRSKECPIICSLPEGHGRLIDADAILNDKGNYFTLGGMGGGDRYYHETILEYSPAIVPAEAERSET